MTSFVMRTSLYERIGFLTHINWEHGVEAHSRYYVLRVAKGALKGRHSPNRQFLQLGKQVCSWHLADMALRRT